MATVKVSSADRAFGLICLRKGLVPADVLRDTEREITALRGQGQDVSLAGLLVERGELAEKQRARIEANRSKHGRPCQRCDHVTYLLPKQTDATTPCERCGGPLRHVPKRRKRAEGKVGDVVSGGEWSDADNSDHQAGSLLTGSEPTMIPATPRGLAESALTMLQSALPSGADWQAATSHPPSMFASQLMSSAPVERKPRSSIKSRPPGPARVRGLDPAARSADEWLVEGIRLIDEEEDYDGALECYRAGLSRDPQHYDCLYNAAALLADLDLTPEALPLVDRLIALDRHNAGLWALKASYLGYVGRGLDGAGCIREVCEHYDPQTVQPDLLQYVVSAFLAGGEPERAVEVSNRALDYDRADVWVLLTRARALVALERLDDAMRAVERAIEADPSDLDPRLFQGRLLIQMGKPRLAEQAFGDAMDADPDSLAACLGLGDALAHGGDLDGALDVFDDVIRRDRSCADGWKCKGMVLYDQGRHEEAAMHFSRAGKLADRDDRPEVMLLEGDALGQAGRHRAALRCFERIMDEFPEVGPAWVRKAHILIELQDLNAALACLEDARRAFGDVVEVRMARLDVLISMERWEAALSDVRYLLEAIPDDPNLWISQGQVLLSIDRVDEAEDSLRRALSMLSPHDPRSPVVERLLEMILYGE
jgi:tetratricopeptide (TPR) repeat protein